MGNITKVFDEDRTTITLINEQYEKDNVPRTRLGLSQAGNSCERFLWYAHNGYIPKQPEGRVLRLFQLGNILEDQVIEDLKSAGIDHYDSQKGVEFTQDGVKLTGSIDGIVKGLVESKVEHLFENKTCSLKKFKELIKHNSYKKWNEVYYWQVQFYMLGLGLKRAAVFVYCKDDSRLYFERVKLDKEATVNRLQNVFSAISVTTPPDRKCSSADWYEAKWCNFYDVCWK